MKPQTTTDAAWGQWTPQERKDLKVRIWRTTEGLFLGVPSLGTPPPGAVIMEPQPRPPPGPDPRAATKEKMTQLKGRYPKEVALGCYWAVRIALESMSVNSRALWERLIAEKEVDPVESSNRWLGAVFHQLQEEKLLKKSNQTVTYSDSARGIHERTIPIWVFVDGADTSKYAVRPAH